MIDKSEIILIIIILFVFMPLILIQMLFAPRISKWARDFDLEIRKGTIIGKLLDNKCVNAWLGVVNNTRLDRVAGIALLIILALILVILLINIIFG